MRSLYVQKVTYSKTPVATLKRWCSLLHQHLCYTLGESNRKIQELFGKLANMKGAAGKLQEAAETTTASAATSELRANAGEAKLGQKRARGASKKRVDQLATLIVAPVAEPAKASSDFLSCMLKTSTDSQAPAKEKEVLVLLCVCCIDTH